MGWNVQNIFHALLFTLFVISIEAQSGVKFVPQRYEIDIVTSKEHFEDGSSNNLKYTGSVKIEFEKNPKTFDKAYSIELNTNQKTEIISHELKGRKESEKEMTSMDCQRDLEKGKLIFKCGDQYKEFTHFTLEVKYKNPFGDDMTGFYRSSYEDSDKKKRWLLTTHFEPIFARNAFPCFDQPDLKAKFKISVTVPKEITTVLSNTKSAKTQDLGQDDKHIFEETNIPMSTYLVAFTASNLASTKKTDFISDYTPKHTPKQRLANPKTKDLQTFGRKEIIDRKEGEFAQSVGKAAIEELTKYLGVGYALEKVDQVGIPDFSAGAMENFGHISFREKSLFYNKDKSTTMTKQSNLLTIVHELVHQWFGNLVTLESWDYIWLNEAFATYLEYIIASKITVPEDDVSTWGLMKQLVVNEIHSRAFETDGLASSKPLTHKITDESLIFSAFNDIPYSKGAAVLRMWHHTHNETLFEKSLQKYINDRREESANPEHLQQAFATVMKMKAEVFKSWTENPGYPVVEVKKTANNTYSLTQSRFLWEKSTQNGVWHIPITWFTSEDSTPPKPSASVWFSTTMELKNIIGKWVIFNSEQAGYYRVNYDKENWEALSKALSEKEHSKIPVVHRAQILNDIFSLARSVQKNYVNYSTAFDLAKYLVNEKDFVPLKTALNSFDFLLTKVPGFEKKISDQFRSYILGLIKPHFKNLTEAASDHLEKLKKVDVTRWACSLNYDPCVKQSRELYNSKNLEKHPDIQEIVLCTVVKSNTSAWDEVFKLYEKNRDSGLGVMYITALGCTDSSTKAEEFLNKTLQTNSGIRNQDLIYVLSAVYNGNSANLDTAFKFVENNFEKIATLYGGINPLGRAIVGIARKINTKDQLERLKALVEKVKKSDAGKGSTENLENAVKIAESNHAWTAEKTKQFNAYFSGSSALASSLGLLVLCLLFVLRL